MALALLAALPAGLAAQGGLTTEGAPFLLIPIGARAVGMGQAVVAEQGGTEAVWWNPAGLARAAKAEVAVHHYQSYVGTGDAVSLLIPSDLLGVLTASLYVLNYDEQETRDPNGNLVGSLLPRNLVYAATYSTTIGSRVNAGITFKVVQLRLDCSGLCPLPTTSASTSAIDIGAQYELHALPVVLGAALRNEGLSFQVHDRDQADPLPTRLQIGALYHVQPVARYAPGAKLDVTADLTGRSDFTAPAARVGADLSFGAIVHLRGGYSFEDSQAAGPAIGFGIAAGDLFVDVGRLFQSFADAAGGAPTYLSLRYLF